MEIRANYGGLIKGVSARIHEIFDEAADVLSIAVPGFVNQKKSEQAQYNASGLSPAGKLVKRPEGEAYPVNRRYKTFNTNYIHTTYSGKLEVSMEMLDDRDFEGVFSETKHLGISARRWGQQAAFQPLINGFTTNAAVNGFDITLYGDGVPMFSTLHPRADGGATQSNASSTGIALTETNLEVGRIALVKQLLDDGSPLALLGPIWLAVPTDLEKTAKIITDSPLRSETSDNDINFYTGGVVNVVASQYLTATHGGSATAWYLLAQGLSHVTLVDRKVPTLWDQISAEGGLDVHVDSRLSVGHSHWLGSWASKGDLGAYAS